MARKPKADTTLVVNPDHEKLLEVLKFTPRTYKIRLWGYGGELVLGEIDKKVWDYFREHKIDVGDWATDSDYGESLEVPEDCRPFYPGEWHDCDSMYHGWGVSKNAGTLEIEDENGNVVYTRDLDSLDGCDVMLSCQDEAFIEMKGKGSCVFYNYSSEKGTFFEGEIDLKAPFDPELLLIKYDEIDSEELVTGIEYDEVEIDNWGGDTSGKGYDFSFYHVDDEGELQQYRSGSDVDEDFDDGTPPSGPSPDSWEKTPKMIGVNPVYSGWYNAHWNSNTWGTLYWNNDKQLWEEYYHGRVTYSYATVDYWTGYNWDTTDWANRPPEPPAVRCKTCDWLGQRDDLRDDDNYDSHCPECDSKKLDWIDYDPNEKKGQKNRKKYCITDADMKPASNLDDLKAEFEKLMDFGPDVVKQAMEELANDELNPWKKSNSEPVGEPTLTYWSVKPLHKKSIEEQEEYTKDGRTITRKTGWRWGEWTVATNDGNPPEFEFNSNGQLDMNSCYSNNIEEVEMIETTDGCWEDYEYSALVTDEEKEELETFIEENDFYQLEEEGWYHSDTYMYVWGPLEITSEDGSITKVVNE